MGNQALKRGSTSDIVYQALKKDILCLRLMPGSAISEIETANKYNVSRTPVRDAFKALSAEGLLEVVPHVGTFVSYIDIREISDILFLREVTEQAVLKIISDSYTQTQILKVRLILNQQKQLIEQLNNADPEKQKEVGSSFLILDNQFHEALFSMAGKHKIWEMIINTYPQYERFRSLLNVAGKPSSIVKLYKEHCDIIEAVMQKDTDKLCRLVSQHIYGGFSEHADIVLNNSQYFKQIQELENL